MTLVPLRQVEAIALDPDAENGVATIGSMDANNLVVGFSQTQATQGGSQVWVVSILAVACHILPEMDASTPVLGARQQC